MVLYFDLFIEMYVGNLAIKIVFYDKKLRNPDRDFSKFLMTHPLILIYIKTSGKCVKLSQRILPFDITFGDLCSYYSNHLESSCSKVVLSTSDLLNTIWQEVIKDSSSLTEALLKFAHYLKNKYIPMVVQLANIISVIE